MTFNFTVKEFILGGGNTTPTLQFYKRGFNLGGSVSPSWQDIILSGNTALTLVNAKADGLNYLKLFGGTEQRNLPSEYTQIEYLQSSDGQTINTGLAGNDNYTIRAKFYDFGGGANCTISGSDSRYGTNYIGRVSGSGSSYRMLLSNKKSSDIPTSIGLHTVEVTSQKITFDGTDYSWTADDNSIGQHLYLFYGYYSSEHYARIRLYYCQIELDGVLLRNFIPAKRNSDNVLGMYDTVTGTFFTNAGTGSFTAGAAVTAPSPNAPMDIVCNNGVVKVNTTGSGKNAIDTSDTEQGYLNSTVGQQPNITSSTASAVIKRAIKVSNGKKYKFSYYSNVAGSREIDIVNNNGVVASKSILTCDVGLNEYIIEANADGYLWVTVQLGDFATVKPTAYEIGLYIDGTIETVDVHSKNLFDKNNVLLDTTVNENGLFEANNSFNCSNYIPVKYGKNYIRSNNGTRFGVRYHLYDSNKNWLGYVDSATTGLIVVSNSSAKYVAFAISKTINLDDVQVELGSTVTTYEPYYNGGTALAEMLLKVGGYQDEQSVLAGSVTRNVGVKIFDGTENWQSIVSPYFSLAKSDITPSALPGDNFNSICSHFVRAASGGTLPEVVAFYWGKSYFSINIDISGATTVNQFKQFLTDQYNAGTPVILIYPLATPTEETVTAQPLTIQAGTNIVEITEASINNLGLEVSYKAGVEVTITEVRNAQLSNGVTVTIS